jgi:hypothetical protein
VRTVEVLVFCLILLETLSDFRFLSLFRGKCKKISFIQNQKDGKIILNIAPKED